MADNDTTINTQCDPGKLCAQPGTVARTLLSISVVVLCAGIVYAAVRAKPRRPSADPTTERIRSLIDEANRLLKELDDKR